MTALVARSLLPQLFITAPERQTWLRRMLLSTWVLNLIDALMTLAVVMAGLAIEANPVMAAALDHGPHVFILTKITLVSAGMWVMWRFRTHRLALVGGALTFAAYIGVSVIHLQSASALLHLLNG